MSNKLSVFDCSVVNLGKVGFDAGHITIVENNGNFPF